MAGYIGTQPVPQATQTRDSFTCTAGQTSFATGGYTPTFLDVYLNGIFLANGADYTASNGSDVILTAGAAADDILEVVAYTTFEVANVTGAEDFTVDGAFTSQGIDDNATSTAITLDASGNLLVGQSTANAAVVGASIRADGEVVATCSGAASGSFNRLGDGATIDVKKDGVIIGSLASDTMDFLVVGQDETGLGFVHDGVDTGNPRIIPRRVGSTSASNNLVDLGDGGSKFKDIHLGGRIKYHTYDVNTELQRQYKQWDTVTTSTNNTWVSAGGSTLVFTPKRPDTTISIFADVKTGQAWSNPSGVNHGQVAWRIKVVNNTGTFYGPVYDDWARVDNFSGIFEKVHVGISEYHMSGWNQDGSAITISIEFKTSRSAGTGLANGGINVWGGLSLYTVQEVLI